MQIVYKNRSIVIGCYCDCTFRRLQQCFFFKKFPRTDNPIEVELICSVDTRGFQHITNNVFSTLHVVAMLQNYKAVIIC